MYDFIGDIHGHADKLVELLIKLGYSETSAGFFHPKRKAFFIGDYIDRGPKIRATLHIVKTMVDNGNAIALMGNHEYNALCFHFQESEGGHLRKHLIKNIVQHYATLSQFQNMQEEYEYFLDWFKSLPLFYETETFRAVHASWHPNSMDNLKGRLINQCLNDELIYESVKIGSAFNLALDTVLKGKELKMPKGLTFNDKEGTKRQEFRIKWWEDPSQMTLKSYSVEDIATLPNTPLELDLLDSQDFYQPTEIPVFFGHYWLSGTPQILKNNVCCLDYSVAKGGNLVAYRFSGEKVLDMGNLVIV